MTELLDWEFTSKWQERWTDWMRPGGHGALADVRNESLALTPLDKPLAESTVALLTTGGVHLKSQTPFDVMKADGDWSLREIPADTPPDALTITHTHYNHLDADKDVNVMFPIERLAELRAAGVVGGVAKTFYGLMGWVPDPRPTVRDTVPTIVARAKSEDVDIILLTPG
jgi:D-proline reductase (dithiol) PrdB